MASSAAAAVALRKLDVLPRADLARQVAERAAHEASAEVEAEHEAASGTGSKKIAP